MIEFQRVTKRYQNGHLGLQDLSLQIKPGEMVFVTGHSGAGKTSLLQIIALIVRHTRGQVRINNINYQDVHDRQIPFIRRNLGMIFQDAKLLDDRTVFDNVALPLIIREFRYQDIARRVRAALDKVGLSRKEHCLPKSLSAGEQQRVSIARAIVHKPTLLLADEPTGNLDPELSEDIINLFLEFNRVGMTQVIASHDINLITPFDKPMLCLHQGRLL